MTCLVSNPFGLAKVKKSNVCALNPERFVGLAKTRPGCSKEAAEAVHYRLASTQARLPAELKHISKRRKRN